MTPRNLGKSKGGPPFPGDHKHPAPVPDADAVEEARRRLKAYRCQHTFDEVTNDGLGLQDKLSSPDDTTIKTGDDEIDLIVDDLSDLLQPRKPMPTREELHTWLRSVFTSSNADHETYTHYGADRAFDYLSTFSAPLPPFPVSLADCVLHFEPNGDSGYDKEPVEDVYNFIRARYEACGRYGAKRKEGE